MACESTPQDIETLQKVRESAGGRIAIMPRVVAIMPRIIAITPRIIARIAEISSSAVFEGLQAVSQTGLGGRKAEVALKTHTEGMRRYRDKIKAQ